jgi:hypothetical protein
LSTWIQEPAASKPRVAWVGRQWAYVMKSLGQNRKSFGYGRPAKDEADRRRCGAHEAQLDHRLPAVLLFQCTDCGHARLSGAMPAMTSAQATSSSFAHVFQASQSSENMRRAWPASRVDVLPNLPKRGYLAGSATSRLASCRPIMSARTSQPSAAVRSLFSWRGWSSASANFCSARARHSAELSMEFPDWARRNVFKQRS